MKIDLDQSEKRNKDFEIELNNSRRREESL